VGEFLRDTAAHKRRCDAIEMSEGDQTYIAYCYRYMDANAVQVKAGA